MPAHSDPDYLARIDAAIAETPPISGAAARRVAAWLAANEPTHPEPPAPPMPPPGGYSLQQWFTEVRPTLGPYDEATADEQLRTLTAAATQRGVATPPFDPGLYNPKPAAPREVPSGGFVTGLYNPKPYGHPVRTVCMPPKFEPATEKTSRSDAWETARRAKLATVAQRDLEAAQMQAAGASGLQIADALGYITRQGAYQAAKRGRARAAELRAAQTPAPAPASPAKTAQQRRDAEAARLNASGFTYAAIAARLGFRTPSGAYQAAQRGCALIGSDPLGDNDPTAAPQRHRYVRGELAVGDEIRTRDTGWRRVVRINQVTVSVARAHNTYRTTVVPYSKITDHRRAGATS